MLQVRRSNERGHATEEWLDTHHTFSFGSYYDPDQLGFRALRVINEDRIAPGTGFGLHPHKDMEIVTYVIEGALEHRDNMGNGSLIRAGDVQRMSAGTGVLHSEMNASSDQEAHLLQIWLLPDERGTVPSYEQRSIPASERAGTLRPVVSPGGRDGSLSIGADVVLHAGLLGPGETILHELASDRHAWVQGVSGELLVNGERLEAGDGAALSGESQLRIEALKESELLVFDLA